MKFDSYIHNTRSIARPTPTPSPIIKSTPGHTQGKYDNAKAQYFRFHYDDKMSHQYTPDHLKFGWFNNYPLPPPPPPPPPQKKKKKKNIYYKLGKQ